MGDRSAGGHREDHAVPAARDDSDNGSGFINHHLFAGCEQRKLTFTRLRPGNINDGAHVEQENWAVVRTVVGDTATTPL